MIDNNNNLYRV